MWSQGSPDLLNGYVFVRITDATSLVRERFVLPMFYTPDVVIVVFQDISHFDPLTEKSFRSFAAEIPVAHGDLDPLAPNSFVVCAVDMFRVDIPILSSAGAHQPVYSQVSGFDPGICGAS